MASQPRFQTSPDVDKCMNYLRRHNKASYAELSTHLNRDIEGSDRYVLSAARRRLERERIVFVTETGVGVSRANDAQIATLSTDDSIGKVRRTVRRSKKRQVIVNVQNLTADQRAAFYIGSAVLGALDQAGRESLKNSITRAVEQADGPLAIEETIKLFSKLKSRNGQ